MEIGKELLYLSKSDVEKVNMPMVRYIDILEEAHKSKSNGEIIQPTKLFMPLDEGFQSFMQATACAINNTRCTGVKWLSGYAENYKRALPRFTGLIILNDYETGCPIAIMDCTLITGMRTAGVNGVALRHLANKESETVGVLGCGVQGRTNLEAVFTECKNIKRVIAWEPNADTLEKYAEEMSGRFGVQVEIAASAKSVVTEADVLLTSSPITKSDEFRVIEPEWLKPGVTAVPVNMDYHFVHETLSVFDKIYVDDINMYRTHQKMGNYRVLAENQPELGDMLTGKAPKRQDKDERIVVFTDGLGINDVSTANEIYKLAIEKGIGTMLAM